MVQALPRVTENPHGTRNRYRQGCHCARCTAANTAFFQRYRESHREHVRALWRAWKRRQRAFEAAY